MSYINEGGSESTDQFLWAFDQMQKKKDHKSFFIQVLHILIKKISKLPGTICFSVSVNHPPKFWSHFYENFFALIIR